MPARPGGIRGGAAPWACPGGVGLTADDFLQYRRCTRRQTAGVFF